MMIDSCDLSSSLCNASINLKGTETRPQLPDHFVESPGPSVAAVFWSWLRHRLVFQNTFEQPPTSSEHHCHLEESAKQFYVKLGELWRDLVSWALKHFFKLRSLMAINTLSCSNCSSSLDPMTTPPLISAAANYSAALLSPSAQLYRPLAQYIWNGDAARHRRSAQRCR